MYILKYILINILITKCDYDVAVIKYYDLTTRQQSEMKIPTRRPRLMGRRLAMSDCVGSLQAQTVLSVFGNGPLSRPHGSPAVLLPE